MVLLIIALLLIIMILLGIIISSHQADEVEEQMRKYDEQKRIMGMEEFRQIRMYIERLDSYKNQGVISDDEYETEKREACRRANELQERYNLYEQ